MTTRKKKDVKFITYKGRVIPIKKGKTLRRTQEIQKSLKKQAKEKGYKSTATFSTAVIGLGIAGVGTKLDEISKNVGYISKRAEKVFSKNYKKPKVSSLERLRATKSGMNEQELRKYLLRKGIKTQWYPRGLRGKRYIGKVSKAASKASKYGSKTTKIGLAIAGVGLAAEGMLRAFD